MCACDPPGGAHGESSDWAETLDRAPIGNRASLTKSVFRGVEVIGAPEDVLTNSDFALSRCPTCTMVPKRLYRASKDPKVGAIVLRIDSPGGSAVASDAISAAVKRVRDAGKPVICSMGNSAASGGYMIAAACDKIVAQPTTITGSIGVVSGKVSIRG